MRRGFFRVRGRFLPSRAHPLRQKPGVSVIRELACAGIGDRRYPGQALRASRPIPAPERPTVGSPHRPPARESPTVSTDAPPFRRRAPSGLPTLPVSRAAHRPDYRRSRFLAHSGRRITDAPPFPRFFAPAAGKKPTHYRRSPFSAQTSQRQPQTLDLALLSNLPRHRQSAASIPTAFRKRKLTFSCFSIDSWRGLPKVGPWIS